MSGKVKLSIISYKTWRLKKIRTEYWRLFTKACYEFEEEKESSGDTNKTISKSTIIEEKALMISQSYDRLW